MAKDDASPRGRAGVPLFDVLVVGAGLAGLQCARLLGRRGLRVLLADRKPAVGAPVHTTGIFVRRTLEDYTLPAGCLGPAVRRVVLHSPAGRRVELASARPEFRLGRMRELYEHFLAEARDAGVQWAPRHRFEGLDATADGVSARFATAAGPRRVRARFVIGADGVLSPVARSLGLSRNREWIIGIEDVFERRGDPAATDAATSEPAFHCFLDPHRAPGYIGWVIDDAATGVHAGVGGLSGRFEPARALDEFVDRVASSVVPSGSLATRLERRANRIPVGDLLPRLACSSGLLVGDAAGAVSPLTAGGLDACMRLSELAADVAASFLASGRDAALLEAYSRRRFARRLVSRRFVRRAFVALSRSALVEPAFALLRLAPCRALAHHVFFGRGSFPDPAGVGRGKSPALLPRHDVGDPAR